MTTVGNSLSDSERRQLWFVWVQCIFQKSMYLYLFHTVILTWTPKYPFSVIFYSSPKTVAKKLVWHYFYMQHDTWISRLYEPTIIHFSTSRWRHWPLFSLSVQAGAYIKVLPSEDALLQSPHPAVEQHQHICTCSAFPLGGKTSPPVTTRHTG